MMWDIIYEIRRRGTMNGNDVNRFKCLNWFLRGYFQNSQPILRHESRHLRQSLCETFPVLRVESFLPPQIVIHC